MLVRRRLNYINICYYEVKKPPNSNAFISALIVVLYVKLGMGLQTIGYTAHHTVLLVSFFDGYLTR